ncbi:MAG: putative Zn-dependent peptidase, partial [bacterium]
MKPLCTLLALMGLSMAPALAQSTDGIADTNDNGAIPVPDLTPHIPDYSLTTRTFVFPSGLTVYVQPDHSQPMVAITTVFDKGSTSDPVGKEGIAHFVEHFWFKSRHLRELDVDGTVLVEGPRTWDVLSEMGCGLNASTWTDWTNYMTICPKTAL